MNAQPGLPPRPLALLNARVVDPATGLDTAGGVLVVGGRIEAAGHDVAEGQLPEGCEIVDCAGHVVAPGLVDMRVFTGEPGNEHRETLASAAQAAAAGGVTSIVCMPDTEPAIDEPALVDYLKRRARDTAIVNVYPMGALTKGLEGRELAEIGLLQEAGAIAFTNGRRTVTNARLMRRALTYARDFDALIDHHAEDPDLAGDGVMNEGEIATRLGLAGIPAAAETIVLDRDMRLVALTRGRYHAAQVSCAASLDVLRRAKEADLAVTCGASINNLALNENDIGPYRTFFRLSPPLRGEEDRTALVAALAEGLIDVVVSAHDPQDVETKRHPFAEAAAGAVGLETLLAAGLRLVHAGDVGLMRLVDALSTRPARLLGLEAGALKRGAPADLVVIDLDAPWILDAAALSSRAKNTAFEGARFTGRVMSTYVAGRRVHQYAGA